MTKLSLRIKFIVGFCSLILLVGMALLFVVRGELYKSLEDEFHKRGVAIGRHLAEASINPILTENHISLQLLVNDYKNNEADIRYIYIVNSRNEVLAHTFGKTFPHELLKAVRRDADVKAAPLKQFQDEEGRFQDIVAMIQQGQLGYVHVGMSEETIRKDLQAIILNMLPYAILILFLGTIVAVLFAATITRPIALLAEGVKRVGRGELNEVIDISTHDEIGLLAESFNTMIENLRQTTVSREFMDKLINTMNDALLVVSSDGIISCVNRAFGELFGYDPAQLTGRRADEFAEQEAPRCIYRMYEYSLKKGRVHGFESICRSTSGVQIPVLFSLAVMSDDLGEPQAVICAAQDISAIKKVQESLEHKQSELEELNQSLEDTVALRTAELAVTNEGLRAEVAERQRTAEELRIARDASEKANRAKTEFLANMSHEMRTPLNAIIGGTEYLEEASLTNDQSRCLNMIRHAGGNLLLLVNDLIDLSRIESGHMELVPREFNMPDLLKNIVQMLSLDAKRKNLELLLDVDRDLPQNLVGDQGRLQQVLVNLVGNAIKFTAEGTVSLSASRAASVGDAIHVTFMVRDTGIGIEPSKLGIIFNTFTQADSSITRKYGGSGLGLAISRRLVEVMGGRLNVESEVGVGSSFSFTVPFRRFHAVSDNSEADGQSNVDQSAVQLENSSLLPLVLLVDDSIDNRKLLRLLLAKKPFVLHEADNGLEALELFEQNNYSMVLMDIQMPVMDGYTATRLMRQIEERSGRMRTPIVALTAHAYEEDISAGLEAGCDGHIAKPFKKEALFSCLERYAVR